MMGVRDQPCHHPQHSEGLNLQVGCLWSALVLIQRHNCIALFIYIQVLHQALLQKVVEAPQLILHSVDVCVCDPRDALVADDERAADPAVLHATSVQFKQQVEVNIELILQLRHPE